MLGMKETTLWPGDETQTKEIMFKFRKIKFQKRDLGQETKFLVQNGVKDWLKERSFGAKIVIWNETLVGH